MRSLIAIIAWVAALASAPAGARWTDAEPFDVSLLAFAVVVDEAVCLDEPFDIRVLLENRGDEPAVIVVHHRKTEPAFDVRMWSPESSSIRPFAEEWVVSSNHGEHGWGSTVNPLRHWHAIAAKGRLEFRARVDLRDHPAAAPGAYSLYVTFFFVRGSDIPPPTEFVVDRPPTRGTTVIRKKIGLEVRPGCQPSSGGGNAGGGRAAAPE